MGIGYLSIPILPSIFWMVIAHWQKYCTIKQSNDAIKKEVIRLRRNNAIKLPDCIVAASSIYLDIPLMTADRGFLKLEELSLMFYEK